MMTNFNCSYILYLLTLWPNGGRCFTPPYTCQGSPLALKNCYPGFTQLFLNLLEFFSPLMIQLEYPLLVMRINTYWDAPYILCLWLECQIICCLHSLFSFFDKFTSRLSKLRKLVYANLISTLLPFPLAFPITSILTLYFCSKLITP